VGAGGRAPGTRLARVDVGVIVPCRGPAPWLGEALDSVLGETPVEVVVVDDASETPIALAARHEEAGVRLVRREARGGPAAARDTGLDALGDVEWVGLCDADDAWLPGKLAAQEAVAAEADVVVAPPLVVGEDGEPTGESWPALHPLTAPHVFEHAPIVNSSALVRREALARAGNFRGLDVQRAVDLELWLRLFEAGARFAAVDEPLVRYRRQGGALTADVAGLAEALLAVHAAHAGLVPPAVSRRVRARDLRLLARGLIRLRRWPGARVALAEATALERPAARDRALGVAVRLPGLRAALGRRRPYTA
jgi:glycosyltransferase involved in cell wall biosynthesis